MKILEQMDVMGNYYKVAVIENEDGSFTSMLKSTYDALQAAQSTPIVE
jgi:hypothetical protein